MLSPTTGSTAGNPKGALVVSGSASGASPVTGVAVYVQRGGSSGLWWDGSTSTWTVAPFPNPATLAAKGVTNTSWTYSLAVPASGGAYEVLSSAVSHGQADQSIGLSTPTPAISYFSISPSDGVTALTASAAYVAPAAAFAVTGSGYQPGEPVTVSFAGTTLATVTASSTGAVPSTSLTMPATAPFGPGSVTATGATSGATGLATVYVSNSWRQYGDTAEHQATDQHDHVFQNHLSVSPGTYLAAAYTFDTGSPISGSAVVDDGVGYVVDQAGKAYAFNVHTGATLWTYQIADGTLVDTTPALNGSGRLLLIASTDGSVYAVQTASGTLAWTAAVGGKLEGSPSIFSTTAYVVSDNGTVTALKTSSGGQLWQVNLGSPVQTSPAVDMADGLVYVGDTAGTVTALNASTGATSWSATGLGDITAAVTVGQGNVYVGSQNGTLYTMNEKTGAASGTTPPARRSPLQCATTPTRFSSATCSAAFTASTRPTASRPSRSSPVNRSWASPARSPSIPQ